MAQRVTNLMMVNNFNRNLNASNNRMNRLQTQMATNRKMVRLSDDPVNVIKALNARSRLNDIEQYQKNLSDARGWLQQTESSLLEVNEILKRCNELAVYASNDILTNDDRNAISEEIVQLRDQIETISNTTMGDKYIFGGYNVSSSPYEMLPDDNDVLYNGESIIDGDIDTDGISYQLNYGLEFDVAITAEQFLGYGENNIYNVLNNFYQTMSSESELNEEGLEILHENVQPFIDQIAKRQSSVLNILADVGGRSARLELMESRFQVDSINYTQMKSDVEDLDLSEAIMNFSMAEAVYRSALGVGGRILPASLMDFMR